MKISQHFSGQFFKSDDFDRQGRNFFIDFVEVEKVGRDEKMVLHLIDEELGFPLNRTNAMSIADIYGDETDEWRGKEVNIYSDKTQFQGRRVDCMRIREPRRNGSAERGATRTSGSGSGSGKTEQEPF